MDTRSYKKESYTSDQLDTLLRRIVHAHLTEIEKKFRELSKNKDEHEQIHNPLFPVVLVKLTDKIFFVDAQTYLTELENYFSDDLDRLYAYPTEISLISEYAYALRSLIKLSDDLKLLNEKKEKLLMMADLIQEKYSKAEYQALQEMIDDIKKPISLAFDETLRKETVKQFIEKMDGYETKMTNFMQPKILKNTCIELIKLCQKYLEDREENKKIFELIYSIEKSIQKNEHLPDKYYQKFLEEMKNNMPKKRFNFNFFPPINIHEQIKQLLEIIEKYLDRKKTPIQQTLTSKKSSSQN